MKKGEGVIQRPTKKKKDSEVKFSGRGREEGLYNKYQEKSVIKQISGFKIIICDFQFCNDVFSKA